ncbi:cell death activator CIDE-B isoform X3 [Electrophorus electricus]|uniref:cell death activator CIDE-B isoform X3 n=1 Tax=Electrophorus electricus TaxID=8005 RepID=UPI0015D035CD|nr:cell death activator CIDE-B isoform X3 [Electrophorus electricus]
METTSSLIKSVSLLPPKTSFRSVSLLPPKTSFRSVSLLPPKTSFRSVSLLPPKTSFRSVSLLPPKTSFRSVSLLPPKTSFRSVSLLPPKTSFRSVSLLPPKISFRSVSRQLWSSPQRPFRVCSWNRVIRKGITAATLQELKKKAAHALLVPAPVSLVCEEDGTEVDSDEFLMALPDNTVLMGMEPGQAWRPHPLGQRSGSIKPADSKPRTGRDIAQVTFDLYRLSPKDTFGSLSVKATFKGLYSIGADFQCLGPKKVLREALRMISTILQAAGHMLITSATVIRRIIQGADLLQVQHDNMQGEYWN